ncbi:MAG TPA: aldehyde dehydrogenase (NADP(+)), partial [Acidobacteriota bacterium]|nr:aldehyde dehydrogenase (NADP(+)) [Acidobacteriota bacterium]
AMELHGKNIIGRHLSGLGSPALAAVNPRTGKKLKPFFYEATMEEVDQALELAERAVPELRDIDDGRRADFLELIVEEILHLGNHLIQRATEETALPEARLTSERGRTINQLRMFASLIREGSWVDARIDRAVPQRHPIPKPDIRRMLIPIGPVVIFGASNFPLAFSVAGGDTASALAAGNPVVVKAHPAHPGTSALVADAILKACERAGMPEGCFSHLHGLSHDVGLRLVRHPATRAVGFTGSFKGGKALFDAAVTRPDPIPVYAEMESINPVFILPGALSRASELAAGLARSVTLGVGQFCTNPGLIVGLTGPGLAKLEEELAQALSGISPETMLYADVRKNFLDQLRQLQQVPGVRVVFQSSAALSESRNEVLPVVLATDYQTFRSNPELSKEAFGPSTLVTVCSSPDEMEALAEGLEGHLTATLHGTDEDLRNNRRLVAILERKVGRLIFNGFPTGVEVCPSMHHGGPFPATTDVHFTSVGTAAIHRFVRPICYQDFPQEILPIQLRDKNVRHIWRLVDGELTRDDC